MNLPPELRKALLSVRAGGLIVLEQGNPPQPSILARLPLRKSQVQGMPVGYGQMELFDYEPEGPIVRMIIQCFDQPVHPLQFDMFLNPTDPVDRRVLERLASSEHIFIHFFSTKVHLPYLSSKQLKWDQEKRDGARRVLQMTEGKSTQWPAAKERVMREYPL